MEKGRGETPRPLERRINIRLSYSWAITVFREILRTVVVSAGIEELNNPEQFGETDEPILRIVIAVMRGTGGIAGARGVAVFRASLAMESVGIEELDEAEEFAEADGPVVGVVAAGVGGAVRLRRATARQVRLCFDSNRTSTFALRATEDITARQVRRRDKGLQPLVWG